MHADDVVLLQGTIQADDTSSRLDNVFERPETPEPISEPTLTRRAASYSDFYHVVRAQIAKDGQNQRKKAPNRKDKAWEALMLAAGNDVELHPTTTALDLTDEIQQQLVEESQKEYM